jgi:release factor glutamine methyltransferase
LQVVAKKKENTRIIDLINWGEDYFAKNDFESPKQEIEWLLCDLLNYKRVDLYINYGEVVSLDKLIQLKKWTNKRLERMPLQYITGNTEFYGNKFFLNKDVLIPRQETERLVDISLECIEKINEPSVLEVGTGSGCISISLALKREDAQILSVDVSGNALKKAKENADFHKTANVIFSKVDILKELPNGKYDILISNPPYISHDEMQNIMIDIKDFEPELALTDFNDGLNFYARLSDIGPLLIRKGGWLVLEVGINDHPNKVMNLFKSKGYKDLTILFDYNNNKRVLKVKI